MSPVQLGIPNSRLRYYLLAKKKPMSFHLPDAGRYAQCCYLCGILTKYSVCKETGGTKFSADIWNLPNSQRCRTPTADSEHKILSEASCDVSRKRCHQYSETSSGVCSHLPQSYNTGSINSDDTLCKHTEATKCISSDAKNNLSEQKHSNSDVELKSVELKYNCRESEILQCQCVQTMHDSKLLHNCHDSTMQPLGRYLSSDGVDKSVMIPEQSLRRFLKVMDVVSTESTRSCCFTKA